jgi:hypothetical protein
MAAEKFYTVDRIEEEQAILVGDAGDELNVALGELPKGLAEGTVLRVPLAAAGDLDWPSARIDADETERRLNEAERLLSDLRRRDPGGDVSL